MLVEGVIQVLPASLRAGGLFALFADGLRQAGEALRGRGTRSRGSPVRTPTIARAFRLFCFVDGQASLGRGLRDFSGEHHEAQAPAVQDPCGQPQVKRRARGWTWTAWHFRQVGGHRRVVGGLGGQRRVDGSLGQRTPVCRRAVLLVRGAANRRAPRSSWV